MVLAKSGAAGEWTPSKAIYGFDGQWDLHPWSVCIFFVFVPNHNLDIQSQYTTLTALVSYGFSTIHLISFEHLRWPKSSDPCGGRSPKESSDPHLPVIAIHWGQTTFFFEIVSVWDGWFYDIVCAHVLFSHYIPIWYIYIYIPCSHIAIFALYNYRPYPLDIKAPPKLSLGPSFFGTWGPLVCQRCSSCWSQHLRGQSGGWWVNSDSFRWIYVISMWD